MSLPEIMDEKRLAWICQESAHHVSFDPFARTSYGLTETDINLLATYVPRDEWFLNQENIHSIHGIRHILRVMVGTLALCKLFTVASDSLLLAASLHDIRRQDDNKDQGHGAKARQFFEDNAVVFVRKFPQVSVEKTALCIEYHECPYALLPETVKERAGKEIMILRAADALDRYRLFRPQGWPNPERIELKEAIR